MAVVIVDVCLQYICIIYIYTHLIYIYRPIYSYFSAPFLHFVKLLFYPAVYGQIEFVDLEFRSSAAYLGTVSYTHLTLPTIYSV